MVYVFRIREMIRKIVARFPEETIEEVTLGE